jgi:IS1 family transposase
MNRLDTARRVQVVRCLVDGTSIRATVRLTGVAKNTVAKLLMDLGCACAAFHHRAVRGLSVKRLQADEVWSFAGAKNNNTTLEQKVQGSGDVWTWVGIDADTKLVVSYLLGDRGKDSAFAFVLDCAERIIGRPQLTTDALKVYPDAVEEGFGTNVDYAQLHKICRAPTEEDYRLTNAFSKKVDNHGHAVALHFMHYNFCRQRQALRVTPAMAAGIADHIWSIEELTDLVENSNCITRARFINLSSTCGKTQSNDR